MRRRSLYVTFMLFFLGTTIGCDSDKTEGMAMDGSFAPADTDSVPGTMVIRTDQGINYIAGAVYVVYEPSDILNTERNTLKFDPATNTRPVDADDQSTIATLPNSMSPDPDDGPDSTPVPERKLIFRLLPDKDWPFSMDFSTDVTDVSKPWEPAVYSTTENLVSVAGSVHLLEMSSTRIAGTFSISTVPFDNVLKSHEPGGIDMGGKIDFSGDFTGTWRFVCMYLEKREGDPTGSNAGVPSEPSGNIDPSTMEVQQYEYKSDFQFTRPYCRNIAKQIGISDNSRLI